MQAHSHPTLEIAPDHPAIGQTDLDRLSPTAIRVFERVTTLWGLSTAEKCVLLGGLAPSTYYKYLKAANVRLSRDTFERISHVLGIYKALNILLPRPEAADAWVRRENDAPLFAGRTALDVMLRGGFEDLIEVRRYLDASRGR